MPVIEHKDESIKIKKFFLVDPVFVHQYWVISFTEQQKMCNIDSISI